MPQKNTNPNPTHLSIAGPDHLLHRHRLDHLLRHRCTPLLQLISKSKPSLSYFSHLLLGSHFIGLMLSDFCNRELKPGLEKLLVKEFTIFCSSFTCYFIIIFTFGH
ncbi:hypothetical protein ES288_A11G281700v1 [Gossypium darwinii]|uniref:Uncharacterized protein n=1 Tax=Gossypium darwinii TaxID=34276 RepID=A0A5D2ER66_GOSDA|nr:hypothetical protein ES288_A11G281700v1 [Gossypium darwinii]